MKTYYQNNRNLNKPSNDYYSFINLEYIPTLPPCPQTTNKFHWKGNAWDLYNLHDQIYLAYTLQLFEYRVDITKFVGANTY